MLRHFPRRMSCCHIFVALLVIAFSVPTIWILFNYLKFPQGGIANHIHAIPSVLTGSPRQDQYFKWETISSFSPVNQDITNASTEDLCRSFPQHRLDYDLQPVLKLGHTESEARVQAQFDSVSACPNDLIVVSDRDEIIRNHTVIDVLNDLPDSYFQDNDQLVNYTIVRDAWNSGHIDDIELPELRGWDLDKYKFLPMVERAWMMRPGKKWYMFYESDTYVVWDNIFRLIDNLDSETPLYVGAAAAGRGGMYLFAYGGGGYLINRAAMTKLLSRRAGDNGELLGGSLLEKYHHDALVDCCGDGLLGWALHKVNIELTNLSPHFSSHSLHTLMFGRKFWCQPLLTMHKTSPDDFEKLWRWEHKMRTNRAPLLYRDFFDFHHAHNTENEREDWDNNDGSRFLSEIPTDLFEDCKKACTEEPNCIQYRWHKRLCRVMDAARYGNPRGPEGEGDEEERRFMSGWNPERIQDLGSRECDEIQWTLAEFTTLDVTR